MVGVAVNVTASPAQIVVPVDMILTDGVTELVTVIVTVLLVALAGLAQAALLVIMTVTASPLANAVEVYVAELLPTFDPFTCH